LEINNGSFTLKIDGTVETTGQILENSQSGGLILEFAGGRTVAAIYAEEQGVLLQWINLVLGTSETDTPDNWDAPWIHGGASGAEFVFLKSHPRT